MNNGICSKELSLLCYTIYYCCQYIAINNILRLFIAMTQVGNAIVEVIIQYETLP